MKPTYFALEFLDSRPFTNYREMLPFLRSPKPQDRKVFAARLSHTSPDYAYRMLNQVLYPPNRAWGWFYFLYLMTHVCSRLTLPWGKLLLAQIANEVSGVFVFLALASFLWVAFQHRGTRSAVRYMARLNDPRAVPLLLKFLHRFPVTETQRFFNEQTCLDVVRLLDELPESQLSQIRAEPLRRFFKHQYFRRLYRSRRPVENAYMYMMVSILQFLIKRPTGMGDDLRKQILSAPLPSKRCPNREIIDMVRDITHSLSPNEKPTGETTSTLKPFTPLPASPPTSPLNVVVGRIGWLEWNARERQ